MTTNRLLPGEIHDAEHVDESAELRSRVESLEEEVRELRREMTQVAGLIRSARIVFGGSPTPVAQETGTPDRWARMKEKLGGKKAEIIQALLDHGQATRSQLRVITGSGMSTVDAMTAKLRDMGLIVKVGDSWKLKE